MLSLFLFQLLIQIDIIPVRRHSRKEAKETNRGGNRTVKPVKKPVDCPEWQMTNDE